jgi:hypothetical protein
MGIQFISQSGNVALREAPRTEWALLEWHPTSGLDKKERTTTAPAFRCLCKPACSQPRTSAAVREGNKDASHCQPSCNAWRIVNLGAPNFTDLLVTQH